MDQRRVHNDNWRELHRTHDAAEARTVLLAIAAMEFDVRCAGMQHTLEAGDDSDFEVGGPPYVVEVRAEDWPDLRGVLETLLEEQAEFDRHFEDRQARKRRFERWMMVVVALGALITMLLASLGCAAEDRQARALPLRSTYG